MKDTCFTKVSFGYTCTLCLLLVNILDISSVQALHGRIPIFQLNAMRYCFQFCILLPFYIKNQRRFDSHVADCYLNKTFLPWVSALMVMTICGNILYYISDTLLPFGTFMAMDVSFQLATLALFSIFVLRQKDHITCICLMLCIHGSILILQPCEIFHNCSNKTDHSIENFNITNCTNITKEYNQTSSSSLNTPSNQSVGYIAISLYASLHSFAGILLKYKLSDFHISYCIYQYLVLEQ